MTGDWPLRSHLEFGPLPGAVPCARLHTRHLLWEWRLSALAGDAEIVVSELMTNALAASAGSHSPVGLWLMSDTQRVAILVSDPSPQPPLRIDAGPETESGRGLLLVESVSATWDWYLLAGGQGKIVWALVVQAPCEGTRPQRPGAVSP